MLILIDSLPVAVMFIVDSTTSNVSDDTWLSLSANVTALLFSLVSKLDFSMFTVTIQEKKNIRK